MFAKLVRWLIGSRDYSVDASDADRAAALLSASGANFRKLRREEDALTFSLPYPDCAPMSRLFEKHNIAVKTVKAHGLLHLLKRYRKRYGIPIGLLLFFTILFASEQFIWTIRVTGNETIPQAVILSRLDELGVGVGTYIPHIDFDEVHAQVLLDYDDLAWISMNVWGTEATVEVLERKNPAAVPDETIPHNLIAKEDGIIRQMEILRGKPIAETDALVRKGELLASGIEEMKHSLRLVHARGRVLAEVKRTIRIEVPLKETARMPSDETYQECHLRFFGISLKLSGNTDGMPADCEKTVTERPIYLAGDIMLPLTIRETVWRANTEREIIRTEAEARAEAYQRLRDACDRETETAELISRKISEGLSSESFIIECELRVLTDIATEAPIYTG